eukprot:IDg19563t1
MAAFVIHGSVKSQAQHESYHPMDMDAESFLVSAMRHYGYLHTHYRGRRQRIAAYPFSHALNRAAVVTAGFSLSGACAADSVKIAIESKDATVFLSFKSLCRLVHKKNGAGTSLRVERDINMQLAIKSANGHDAFNVLCAIKHGVYAVRLRQDEHVDHAVFANANNRVIIDSEEKVALRLLVDVLDRCRGAGADNLRVCEAHRVSKC